MKDETHLPTEQTEAQEKIWIPGPDENRRRPQGHPPTPTRRKKSPHRLKVRSEFLAVAKEGRRLVGSLLCLDVRKSRRFRFGITASTRYGNAPERNRFKRLVREALRTGHPPCCEINVLPRQRAKGASMGQIQKELFDLLRGAS